MGPTRYSAAAKTLKNDYDDEDDDEDDKDQQQRFSIRSRKIGPKWHRMTERFSPGSKSTECSSLL
jgi:hypothetical protein